MKDSIYNIFFEYNNKIIGFNTLYNTCLSISPNVYELLKEKFNLNLSKAASYSKKIDNILQENKFIIDENTDEHFIINDILRQNIGDKSQLYIIINRNHSIFRHDNFIGCFSADKIKMPARKYFCFNIPVYKNMVEEPSCRSPYHKEYIRTGASGNPEDLCH